MSSAVSFLGPLLFLLAALSSPAQADTVAVPVDAVLGKKDPVPTEKPAVGWMVSQGTTTIRPDGELVYVDTRLVLTPTDGPVWVNLRVLDGSVILTRDSGLERGTDNHWWVTRQIDKPTVITATGLVPTNAAQLQLMVAPSVRQEVVTVGDELVFVVDGAVDGFLPPTARVRVSWSTERAAKPLREVVQASVASAAWYEDDALWLRSKVRFTVRRGQVSRFSISLPPGLTELDVQAPGATWQTQGNTLVVVADKPIEGALDVTVQGRLPFKKNQVSLTQLQPQQTSSTSWTLTLAGTSDALLSPAVSGLHPTALSELPPDARSIGDAPATVAWTGKGTLNVTALQLQALDGPALVIDRAVCTEATSVGGRSLLRCRMDVRNASAQFLRVQPPPGMQLWSARVNGDGVAPVKADPWTAIPLERSVETLAGLTQLDLDVTFVAEDDAWEKKGVREKSLPVFDAPVAVLEWELRLPPGFKGEVEGGSVNPLAPSDTEIVYAYVVDEKKDDKDQARDTWNQALSAYQENDFETAQTYINETLVLDPDNANAKALQSNLDVFSGDDGGRYATVEEEAMSRKVKETAKAKVADKEVLENQLLEEADEYMARGDYEEAERRYAEAAEISEDLAQYDQVESNESTYRSNSSRKKAEEARRAREQTRPDPVVVYKNRTEIDFEGVQVEGQLVKPQGAVIVESAPAGGDYEVYFDDDELMIGGEDLDGLFASGDLDGDLDQGIGGLIGAKGEQVGSGGLGTRGSGLGGGGQAEGLGGLGTKGRGSGASGYGSGGGTFGAAAPSAPEEPEVVTGVAEYSQFEPMPVAEPEPEPVPMDEPYFDDLADYDAYDYESNVVQNRAYSGEVITESTTMSLPGVSARPARDAPPPPPPIAAGRKDAKKKPAATPDQPTVPQGRVELSQLPDLAATTWGVPLPEHGQPVVLTQRLLAPGEAATVTLKYRETK